MKPLDYFSVHGQGNGIIKVACYKKPIIRNDTITILLNSSRKKKDEICFHVNEYEALLLSRLLIWAVQRRKGFTYSKM